MTVVSTRHHTAGLVAAAAGAIVLCLVVSDASAQFGSIFGDPQPPRPPAGVPGGRQQSPFPQPFGEPPSRRQQFPQQESPDQFPERLPPGPPPSARRAPAPIQAEPLPPADGGPASQQSGVAPGLPPGVRQPRGTPQPANTAPQPGDEVVSAPPTQKIPNQTAVFSGLDKITGRIISFDVAVGETVQFGALQVVPRACYTRPPTEAAATDSFVEVSEVTLQGEVRRIFAGWMFAASPGLNAVEHPIYDVWLTDCKQPLVKVAEDPSPLPQAGTPQQAPAQQQTAPRQPQAAQQPRTRPQAQPQQQRPAEFNRAFPAPIR
jgi:hypothetical protein